MTQHRRTDGLYGPGRFDHMGCANAADSLGGSAQHMTTGPAQPSATAAVPTFVFLDLHVTAPRSSDTVQGSMASTMASQHLSGSVYQPPGDAHQAISIRGPATMAGLGVSLIIG